MNWKTIGLSLKNTDMRNRILAVAGMLLVFRLLAHIPIPLANPETLRTVLDNIYTSSQSSQLLSFINVLSGGALANFSIMLIGMGPYINASIIMQLLTKAIPSLEKLNKEGEFGRKKINQYTRMLTFPLAIVNSIGSLYLVRQTAAQFSGLGDITAGTTPIQWVLMIASLTGGAMILMWLGELITEQSIGNGISLIITVGIVSQLPATIASFASSVTSGNAASGDTIVLFGKLLSTRSLIVTSIVLLVTILVTIFIVKLNEASRQITINYAKRVQGSSAYGGVTTILPIKLITAGVVPIIFAVAFLSIPTFAGQLLANNTSERLRTFGSTIGEMFQNPTAQTFEKPGIEPYIYPIVYFVLVFAFTFFYTSIAFNAKEIAENLQKQGGFIPGVRSGSKTESYLSKVVSRLTLFGALSLGFLALLPIVGQIFVSSNIAIGGTSVLILVSVALETLRQIESRALMVTYDQYAEPGFLTGYDSTDVVKKRGLRKLFNRKKAPKTSTKKAAKSPLASKKASKTRVRKK